MEDAEPVDQPNAANAEPGGADDQQELAEQRDQELHNANPANGELNRSIASRPNPEAEHVVAREDQQNVDKIRFWLTLNSS